MRKEDRWQAGYTDILFSSSLRVSALQAQAHLSIANGSTDILEHLLEHDSCDPDVRNRLAGDTPLHIAVRQRWEDHPGMRLYLGVWACGAELTAVGSLLEAGADQLCERLMLTTNNRIKNRHNERPADALPPWHEGADLESDDEKVRGMLRRALAETMVASSGDVVNGEHFMSTR